MTARKRALPINEAKELLDMLKGYGIDLAKCAIDIGPDGVKVSPPANINAAESKLAPFIKRTPPGPKADQKR